MNSLKRSRVEIHVNVSLLPHYMSTPDLVWYGEGGDTGGYMHLHMSVTRNICVHECIFMHTNVLLRKHPELWRSEVTLFVPGDQGFGDLLKR